MKDYVIVDVMILTLAWYIQWPTRTTAGVCWRGTDRKRTNSESFLLYMENLKTLVKEFIRVELLY